jgi:hypothetical protein
MSKLLNYVIVKELQPHTLLKLRDNLRIDHLARHVINQHPLAVARVAIIPNIAISDTSIPTTFATAIAAAALDALQHIAVQLTPHVGAVVPVIFATDEQALVDTSLHVRYGCGLRHVGVNPPCPLSVLLALDVEECFGKLGVRAARW